MNLPVDVGSAEWILNTGLRILLISALSVFVLFPPSHKYIALF